MMDKVVDYCIVQHSHRDALEREVKNRMEDGWVPSGVITLQGHQLIQTMVRFE